MTEQDRNLILEVGTSVAGDTVTIDGLLHGCIHDAGYDFDGTGLDFTALASVWSGSAADVNWLAVGFFAGELLAFYSAMEQPLDPKTIPRWVFASFLIRDAINNGYSSWDLQDGKIAVLFQKSDQLAADHRQRVLQTLGRSD